MDMSTLDCLITELQLQLSAAISSQAFSRGYGILMLV